MDKEQEINNKNIEEFEKKQKEKIYGSIYDITSNQSNFITEMCSGFRKVGEKEPDIPNVGITVNNKIVDISKRFEAAGISMFYSKSEKYDKLATSFIGDSIIMDLVAELRKATQKLNEYGIEVTKIYEKKNNELNKLQVMNPVKRFFAKIRNFFVPRVNVIQLSEDEKNILNIKLQEYKKSDEDIWKYNLDEKIIQALVNEIANPVVSEQITLSHKYNGEIVPELFEERIVNDMIKLGYESKIPELKKIIIDRYEKELIDSKVVIPKEYMYMYVPDFEKNKKKNDIVVQDKVNNINSIKERCEE